MVKTRSGKFYWSPPSINQRKRFKKNLIQQNENKVAKKPRFLPDSNAKYTFQRPFPQQFSISFSIIKYIYSNPSSPKAWKKLIQTCKYFFFKNPLYPVAYLETVDHSDYQIANSQYALGEAINPNLIVSNLWLHETLFSYSRDPRKTSMNWNTFVTDAISRLLPKIAKLDLRNLDIRNQKLLWNEYKLLTSSGTIQNLTIDCCCIQYPEGKDVPFDRLFDFLQNLKILFIRFINASLMLPPGTTKNVVQIIPSLKNLSQLRLCNLTENFEILTFAEFVMTNKSVKIEMNFQQPISNSYKKVLENFVDKIVENPPAIIPKIRFPECDKIKVLEYEKLFQQNQQNGQIMKQTLPN